MGGGDTSLKPSSPVPISFLSAIILATRADDLEEEEEEKYVEINDDAEEDEADTVLNLDRLLLHEVQTPFASDFEQASPGLKSG